MLRGACMSQPDMTPLLSNLLVTQLDQGIDQAFTGHATGEFHAATRGINSSLM